MSPEMLDLLLKSFWETCYMVLASTILATLIGVPLGVILTVTRKPYPAQRSCKQRFRRYCQRYPLNSLHYINGSDHSSDPPFSRLFDRYYRFHRTLTISAAPFIARIIESSLLEIDHGVIEAAQAMGASPMQIIRKVLLPEALHSIVLGITLAVIALIGYSAMAGTLGGGGLGDLAIRYGYQRFQMDVMLITVVVLIVMVQSIQSLGDYFSKKLNKNKL